MTLKCCEEEGVWFGNVLFYADDVVLLGRFTAGMSRL